ncbi:MAG: single-stranded-DNA-specific exonuclease RecJ [Betaproteobacteria bacterium]|nr:single-stranded-DNA-specific exonuclease RecJ [Betaproteobacteria bacterium]
MHLNIARRTAPPAAQSALAAAGIHPLLAQIYAARGIASPQQLAADLGGLSPLAGLHNVERMAGLLADAIAAKQRLLIVADYDSDGATACAVGMRALREFGANVEFLVPNRFEYGYGLTPEIVALAKQLKNPDILITVDNGIASVDGVAAANALGMRVLITDHHLPGATLPDAWCIINPNQPGCGFPSKNLAGVGVMFYLMLALRAELRKRGWFESARGNAAALEDEVPASPLTPHASRRTAEPNLAALLDLVALGTVADVVKLDDNNRILVQQGLQRIRSGKTWPGIAALLRVGGREAARASTYDLGFVLGPRLNAAGRLDDMAVGIECLITNDPGTAERIARQLDEFNRKRRSIEADMHEDALASLAALPPQDSYSLSLFDPGWHQGVIGIVASRLKERYHRPVIAFARGNDGEIKGSGRSIGALHLRDALDLVAKRAPDLILRFGGHAAAAGLTLHEAGFERFRAEFETVVQTLLSPADLDRIIETDGALPVEHCTLEAARVLEHAVWGQGFPAPTFDDEFTVARQRVVGERHLKLRLTKDGRDIEAMLFSHAEPLPPRIRAVYRIGVNEWNGAQTLQLTIEHWQPA